jgi:hypothetical protein
MISCALRVLQVLSPWQGLPGVGSRNFIVVLSYGGDEPETLYLKPGNLEHSLDQNDLVNCICISWNIIMAHHPDFTAELNHEQRNSKMGQGIHVEKFGVDRFIIK